METVTNTYTCKNDWHAWCTKKHSRKFNSHVSTSLELLKLWMWQYESCVGAWRCCPRTVENRNTKHMV